MKTTPDTNKRQTLCMERCTAPLSFPGCLEALIAASNPGLRSMKFTVERVRNDGLPVVAILQVDQPRTAGAFEDQYKKLVNDIEGIYSTAKEFHGKVC
jgi:hypothetical protein